MDPQMNTNQLHRSGAESSSAEHGPPNRGLLSKPYLVISLVAPGCLVLLSIVSLGSLPAAFFLFVPMLILDLIGHRGLDPDAAWGLFIVVSGWSVFAVFTVGIAAHWIARSTRPRWAKPVFVSGLFLCLFLFPLFLVLLNTQWE
jgi:hypothetical protein